MAIHVDKGKGWKQGEIRKCKELPPIRKRARGESNHRTKQFDVLYKWFIEEQIIKAMKANIVVNQGKLNGFVALEGQAGIRHDTAMQ